jgi:plasmid stabilization system protein ParE
MENRRISWDIQALKQFNKAILYIAEDSIQNAENVRGQVLEKIEELVTHPEIYPPDKYKTDNDGNYRAFELHRLRVAYYISTNIIRILRVRHTSREPLTY